MEEYFQTFFQIIIFWKKVWKQSFMRNDWHLYQVLRYPRKRAKQKIKNINSFTSTPLTHIEPMSYFGPL